jgi:hypothetical protein
MAWWYLSIADYGKQNRHRFSEEYRIGISDEYRRVHTYMREVRSIMDSWEPFSFEYRPQERLKGIDASHYYKPDLGYLLPLVWRFSARAVDVLRPLIENDVEILPLICDTDELYAVNIVSAPKAVNVRRSQKNKHGSLVFSGLHINRRKLHGYNVFRLYEVPFVATFVTDAVKEAIEAAELSGAACVKWLE